MSYCIMDSVYLQQLYVKLDEPDGVAGITAIKHTQPTLSEQILAYESIGMCDIWVISACAITITSK